MADAAAGPELNHSILNLTADEKRIFSYLFAQADTDKLGVITGEVAVKFFERTKLQPAVLGEIWQIADTENRGLLTSAGFCQVLRLIGHYQAGRDPTPELAFKPGPLPKFEGLSLPPALPAASSPTPTGVQAPFNSGPIRVPPLSPAKAAEYAALFEKSGAQSGILSGENAKQIFEKARLPNEILGHIWNLADTEERGALGVTEFIIAMHLLASYKTGALKALPSSLPAGLHEAASRRGSVSQPPGRPRPDEPAAPIPRQFSGAGSQRNQSPLARPPYAPPSQPAPPPAEEWLINASDKASYDSLFNKVDTSGRGFITGEQAVQFFSDSGLPEDILASIWDLADINSEGQLNRDEFAVAMYLIRRQRKPGISLPTTLPSNLVPPSMRSQSRPVPPPQTAPVEPPAFPPPVKSAAEDLFGLDAFAGSAPKQTQQSTGGSGSFGKPFEVDPFASKTASPTSPHGFQASQRGPGSSFKPFMPSSSFGQTLTSHSTGASGSSSVPPVRANPPSAMDDLLGDNDPEVNKKLTQETTELANMSNQIGTLRTQMQEVQNKKVSTEGELNGASAQKRDLELRLSQFKSQYEQEAKSVKSLEDRLLSTRNENRKLQQELAAIEGTYQDVQGQHRQFATQLDADQRENARLKDRMRHVNSEISQLRPQIEKMKSDARHQKGLVAISRKQLATSEGERDKMKSELNDLSKELQAPPQEPTTSVASPPTSTASHSTNPFFRKATQSSGDNTMTPSGFSREGSGSQPHKDFDNVFGSFAPAASSAAPPTSFRSEPQGQGPVFSAASGPSVRSSEPDVPTPSTSPPLSSYQDSPRTGDPPAPPESRQFASSFLPLRDAVPRAESFSSSVKVAAPGSRYGPPGNETPTISKGSPSSTPVPEKANVERPEAAAPSDVHDRKLTASPPTSIASDVAKGAPKADERKDTFSILGAPSAPDIPGAFPRDASSPIQQMPTGGSGMSDWSKGTNRAEGGNRTDPFSVARDQPRGGNSAKVDFDAAFAGFGGGRQVQDPGSVNGSADSASKFNKEFPPIEDLGHDDSDSNSEHGFADNFTSASPRQQRRNTQQSQRSQARPSTSTAGEAEDIGRMQQKEPGGSVSSLGTQKPKESPFPDFGGMLPARQDSAPVPPPSRSPERTFSSSSSGQGTALFGGAAKPTTPGGPAAFATSTPSADTPSSTVPSDAYHSAVSFKDDASKGPTAGPSTSQPGKAFSDDFDAGFDDLTEAKEADDRTDDDFMLAPHHRDHLDEFNPVFDSPAASKSNTMNSQQTPTGKPAHPEDNFSEFDQLAQSFGQSLSQQPAASTQDWDAIFSNLEAPSKEAQGNLAKSAFDSLSPSDVPGSSKAPMPELGRAISTGTTHDDPILKKLTGMGYARTDALGALEKFDYDINKAVDYLSAKQ